MRTLLPIIVGVSLFVAVSYYGAAQLLSVRFDKLNLPLNSIFTPGKPQGTVDFSIVNNSNNPFYFSEAVLQLTYHNMLLGAITILQPVYIAAKSITAVSGLLMVSSRSIITTLIGIAATGNLNQYLNITGYVRIGPFKVPVNERIGVNQILTYGNS